MAEDSSPPRTGSTEQIAPPSTPSGGGNGGGTPPKSSASKSRGPLFMIFGGVVILGGLAWGAYQLLEGGKTVSTDNAYVEASSATVTPQIAATVKTADIYDTKPVKAGDVLVTLDDTDARLTLDQAQAQLDQARRQVRGYYSADVTLAAQANAAQADVAAAEAAVTQAQKAYDDRKSLAAIGAVAGEDLTNARATLDRAQAALAAARAQAAAAQGQRAQNAVLISDADVEANPAVRAAEVRVQQAQVDLDRAVLRAPISGVIAKNTVEVGQRVQVGTPIMTIVPIENAYVNANFKEVQLKKVKIGQPVILTSDLYGNGVKFHGKVVGLSGGTGSAFSVIPAQNATGNWIKVVQRLPVRIALNPRELKQHPLRVGMSMDAKIDVAD
ncbi:MAG: HlyD family efflux transporter periplasmic adaptor subunit [Asticcacaulis sp.]|nr:HlyD family efflux transporter periplasmic adaptor subunit [Asticcacaulis sp.]